LISVINISNGFLKENKGLDNIELIELEKVLLRSKNKKMKILSCSIKNSERNEGIHLKMYCKFSENQSNKRSIQSSSLKLSKLKKLLNMDFR
jgi:hypothetical protein